MVMRSGIVEGKQCMIKEGRGNDFINVYIEKNVDTQPGKNRS
jgi:hypothetical protein